MSLVSQSEEFRPIISSSMNEVGAARSSKEMMRKYTVPPFRKAESLDRDVTDKSLDGLFFMVGREEKKVRIDPRPRGSPNSSRRSSGVHNGVE